MTLAQIRDMVKEMFHRNTLSMQTCLNVIKKDNPWIQDKEAEAVATWMLDATYWNLLERKYNREKEKMFKEAILYKQTWEKLIEEFKKVLKDTDWEAELVLADYELPEWVQAQSWTSLLFISDLHYWRQTEALISSFQWMLRQVYYSWHKEIHIFCLWDLFETPILTWMHVDQLLELDKFWVKQVIGCMDMLIKWIQWLFNHWINVTAFTAVAGNHDRITKSWNEDPEKIIMMLAMEYLNAKIWDKVKIDFWWTSILVRQFYGCNFILHHGDNWFLQKQDTQILQTYGRMDMCNIIVSWHTHTWALTQWTNYLRLRIPALCQPGRYEKDQYIWSANPWYVLMKIYWWVPSPEFHLLPFIYS